MIITELSEAYDQKDLPACSSFAVAGYCNYLLKSAGIEDRIDPVFLFNETDRNHNGSNFPKLLEFGFNTGFKGALDTRYKLKDCGFVSLDTDAMIAAFKRYHLLLLEYHLCDGDNFTSRLQNGTLARQPNDTHSMIIRGLDEENHRVLVRNSWGKNWGIDGDFWIPFTLLRSPYTSRFAWLSLNI